MGSALSTAVNTVVSTVESVCCWIAEGVVAIGTAIWHAVKFLFTKIRDACVWFASWLASCSVEQPSSPTATTPISTGTTHIKLGSAIAQKKQAMVKVLGEAKGVMKDMTECLQDMEDAMKENIATGNTQETEQKLREVQQKAEMKNIVGRLESLRITVPSSLT